MAADGLPRLSPATVENLGADIARPRYPRAALTVGHAHLGVGAFHRCHQALYSEDLLETAFGPWGLVGINLRPPDLGETLGPQGGLYCHITRQGAQATPRVVGAMVEVVQATDDSAPAVARLAAPDIKVVTLTVTEKGYCHVPATGALDPENADLRHDLSVPDRPRSVPGVLVAALERRRRSGAGPLTLMSCDNVPANGVVLRGVVVETARRRDPALADWIEAHVRFPSSMVDRIVPASAPADFAEAARRLGLDDRATVVSEPFRQWVIEDAFAGPRPAWERVGAQIVTDVAPYEILKMRVVNGCQSGLCYLGSLAGIATMSEVVADPDFRGFVARLLERETVPTLRVPPDIDLGAYVETTYRRLSNPAIRHTTAQIAMDGSQKIPQRLLAPLRARLRSGLESPCLVLAVAAWMRFVTRRDADGHPVVADDPMGERLAAIGREAGGEPRALVRGLLSVRAVFSEDLAGDERLEARLTDALGGLMRTPARACVRAACATEQ